MGDLGMQVSVRLSVRPSVNIYMGVLWTQLLLQFLAHLSREAHKVSL